MFIIFYIPNNSGMYYVLKTYNPFLTKNVDVIGIYTFVFNLNIICGVVVTLFWTSNGPEDNITSANIRSKE